MRRKVTWARHQSVAFWRLAAPGIGASGAGVWLVAGLLACVLALATPTTSADPAESTSETADAAATVRKKPGYYLGGLRVRPSISLTARYDDNVFTTSSDEKTDWITLFSPRIKVDQAGAQVRLQLKAGVEAGYYHAYDNEDYVDYWGDTHAQFQLSDNVRVSGGLGISYDHENRDSLDAPAGALEPTTYRKAHANLGSRIEDGALSYRFGLTYESLDFDNVPSVGGIIINEDRDRDLLGAGLRIAARLDEANQVFLHALVGTRDYAQSVDQFGYRRSSDGYRAALGLTHSWNENHLEAYVGSLVQRYDDARFGRVRKPDLGGKIRLTPGPGLKLNLKLQRSVNETIDIGSAGYLNTAFSVGAEYTVSPRLSLSASAGHTVSDYLNTQREDKTTSVTLAAQYFVTPNSYLVGGISHASRDSNDAGLISGSNDFDRNLIFLNLVILAYPLSH